MPSRLIDADTTQSAAPTPAYCASPEDSAAEMEKLIILFSVVRTEKSAPDTKAPEGECVGRRIPMSASGVMPPPFRFVRRERPVSLSAAPRGPSPAKLDKDFLGADYLPSQSGRGGPNPIDNNSKFDELLAILMRTNA